MTDLAGGIKNICEEFGLIRNNENINYYTTL